MPWSTPPTPPRGGSVLDLGTGTGALAARLATRGCVVTGVDFSPWMLARARAAVSGAAFVAMDLRGDCSPLAGRRFDRIVSAYVLHAFDPPARHAMLDRLAREHLAGGGAIAVGDIAFPTDADRERRRREQGDAWDEDERYWAADVDIPALDRLGLNAGYLQVTPFAGVFRIGRRAG